MPWYRVNRNVFLNGEYVEAGEVGFSPNTISDPIYTLVSGPDTPAPHFLIPPFSEEESLNLGAFSAASFDGTNIVLTRIDGSSISLGPFTGGGGGSSTGPILDGSGSALLDGSGGTISS